MYKILIVEDDSTIAALVAENLGQWGYQAQCVSDFNNVSAEFEAVQPHLVLLDIGLPSFNGFYWCREIRKFSNVPIIFLSSHTEKMDIVMAMNMGGDDYITKPFSLEVLIAKVQAVLRRAYALGAEPQILEAGGVILNLNNTQLDYQDVTVELTKNEFKIMQLLMERKNKVVTREQMMLRLWDSDSFVDDNTLTVNVNRLRKKLEDAGIRDFITTKKGLGYIVND
ncbi:MAG TPA: DNA-binding response regulator [Firmicutes bacterium]|nr:DNA-binding response regulator [Bacillota bacterium]